ncbi:MAG TPA: sensor histidine kinase, partial [Bryobacteraceae bacterium]|nr:sensor histidine kinase [Bryobacteraceae bacterium]
MRRSLRSTLILASVLWTGGLLALMHMLSLLLIHGMPGVLRLDHRIGIFVGGLLMSAGAFTLIHGVAPFRLLKEKLIATTRGEHRHIDGSYPGEVQPLIDQLNALLEDRDRAVKRALASAGDLAHGLKTPLALLAQEADRAAAEGHSELAHNIVQHVDRMSRHVNYHLARARAAASGAAGAGLCPVAACVDAVVRTLAKLHAERSLDFSVTVATDLHARVQREDMEEMLGNLLENASKWASRRIAVSAVQTGDGKVHVLIDDDGPGLPPDLRSVVLQRGVRIDEAAPGWGLGLAIVRDLAEIYSGSISLEDS